MATTTTLLRRYTDLPAAIGMLRSRAITLLSPASWDDKNDSHFLKVYQEKKSLSCLAALCFTQASETYHHWRVFSAGASGVCIQFNRTRLLAALKTKAGVTVRGVDYRSMSEMRAKAPALTDLPFVKRAPFKDENELRIIFESQKRTVSSVEFKIPLLAIDRVVLSPWMHLSLKDHVTTTLREIPGCRSLKIVRSTLIGSDEWRAIGGGAA